MPVLKQFSACRVVVYVGDHPAPHVHLQLRDGRECTVDLHSLRIRGDVVPREIREALNWVRQNRDWLLAEWRRHNP